MNNRKKSKWYEDMVPYVPPAAAAIGRRAPYYLTYLKKYQGKIPVPEKTECTVKNKKE